MYSVLPGFVAVLFLAYGFFAIASRGVNRLTMTFFLLCLATFFWQGTWAVLFQTNDPDSALKLVKLGYFFILFLPTSIYHFLVLITEREPELRYVYFSYAIAAVLAVFDIFTNLFVSGYYQYFWGYYPKAGLLHPIHLAQTVIVVNRGLYLTYITQKTAPTSLQDRLRLCLVGLLIYFFAAMDYLCNYGIEFYPLGVIFVAISAGFLTIAIAKYDLLHPVTLAGSIAHEMRTPLATIRNQATGIANHLPTLLESYMLSVEHKLVDPSISNEHLGMLSDISGRIASEVNKSNTIIDMLLASAALEHPEELAFKEYSINSCIREALDRYPFEPGQKERVHVDISYDFQFHGSDTLLVFVLFNLMKNAFAAIQSSGQGDIRIFTGKHPDGNNLLHVSDTGPGIPADLLPRIFDPMVTTRRLKGGNGLGLSFCKKAMNAFKGRIVCESVEGKYTIFALEFPSR